MERACPACGTVASPEARFCGACGHRIAADARTPAQSPALKSEKPERYTPSHLAERILGSRGALEGERKQVTILFADLKGSLEMIEGADPEHTQAILDSTVGAMRRQISGSIRSRRTRREERRAAKERVQREAEQKRLAAIRAAEWEAARPERDRLELERAERERVEANRQQIDSERRENARQQLLLCYHQHSPCVQDSISWERYNEYVAKYLSNDVPTDQVEENAERMIGTIESFFEPAEQPQKYRSVEAIRGQFQEEREEVMSAGYDEQRTASMLADIAIREDQALMEERR